MAPEVLLRRNHSFCADLYAVGVIAYELFVGNRPYKEKERKALREEMLLKEAKIPTEIAARMSKEAVDFTHRVAN
jgi:serine/threonine protein kinase